MTTIGFASGFLVGYCDKKGLDMRDNVKDLSLYGSSVATFLLTYSSSHLLKSVHKKKANNLQRALNSEYFTLNYPNGEKKRFKDLDPLAQKDSKQKIKNDLENLEQKIYENNPLARSANATLKVAVATCVGYAIGDILGYIL